MPEEPTVEDLHEQNRIEGVAVVHDDYGTGEVVDTAFGYDWEVYVEFGQFGEARHVRTADLQIDHDYYADLDADQAGYDHAAERGLVQG